MTLTEFLLARIAEDEAAILDHWGSDGRGRVASMWTGAEPGYVTVAIDQRDGVWFADGREVVNARHVRVLFDPSRVLAECEAKRRIVVEHASTAGYRECDPVECRSCSWVGNAVGCDTLRLLALPYADHPDYDEEWRP